MKIIAHLDMDAFFAAVEERDRPELQGLPLVVGADPDGGKGRGVVSTANYRARQYGIHSAMPISRAWQLSQAAHRRGQAEVVFLHPNFARYKEVSRRIMALVCRYASLVEVAGIDEAYLDLTFAGSFAIAQEICHKIKEEIKARENLTASLGIGPNKMIAKIASDFHKPDGLTLVTPEEAAEFLAPLPVRKIPGIGPKTEIFLAAKKIKTVADLKKLTLEKLEELFGKWGLSLYEKVRGRSSATLELEHEAKSLGEQETFPQDTRDLTFLFERLWLMCRSVHDRLLAHGFGTFRTVVVTVRFADFDTKTRSHTLAHPTDSLRLLHFEAMKLLMPFLDRRENPKKKLFRLLGVRLEKLSQGH